jgi:hypothetical protein
VLATNYTPRHRAFIGYGVVKSKRKRNPGEGRPEEGSLLPRGGHLFPPKSERLASRSGQRQPKATGSLVLGSPSARHGAISLFPAMKNIDKGEGLKSRLHHASQATSQVRRAAV